jgi:hypothetical protein
VILFFFHLPFSQGDPVKLLEDVQALRPTIFPGVPRVWQRIYGAAASTRRCHSVCADGHGCDRTMHFGADIVLFASA